MELATPVLAVLCGLAAFAAGWRTAERSPSAAVAGAAAAALLVGVRVAFRFRPEWEQSLLRFDLYAAAQLHWVFPVGAFALGVGARRWGAPAGRWACVLAAGALVVFSAAGAWPGRADFRALPAVARDGVVLQTQEYTCGPAAAATLLGQLGVAACEGEMARLCRSAAWLGTTEGALCRALRLKLDSEDFGVAFVRPDGERLARFMRPVLARVRAGPWRDHWVVLLAINDRVAIVGDPALGRVEVPVARFLRDWRGTAIVVDREFLLPGAGQAQGMSIPAARSN